MDGGVRVTRNPYQLAAAAFVLVGAVLRMAGIAALSLPILTVGLAFALVAYGKRQDYPR
jgi:hypothetical protein